MTEQIVFSAIPLVLVTLQIIMACCTDATSVSIEAGIENTGSRVLRRRQRVFFVFLTCLLSVMTGVLGLFTNNRSDNRANDFYVCLGMQVFFLWMSYLYIKMIMHISDESAISITGPLQTTQPAERTDILFPTYNNEVISISLKTASTASYVFLLTGVIVNVGSVSFFIGTAATSQESSIVRSKDMTVMFSTIHTVSIMALINTTLGCIKTYMFYKNAGHSPFFARHDIRMFFYFSIQCALYIIASLIIMTLFMIKGLHAVLLNPRIFVTFTAVVPFLMSCIENYDIKEAKKLYNTELQANNTMYPLIEIASEEEDKDTDVFVFSATAIDCHEITKDISILSHAYKYMKSIQKQQLLDFIFEVYVDLPSKPYTDVYYLHDIYLRHINNISETKMNLTSQTRQTCLCEITKLMDADRNSQVDLVATFFLPGPFKEAVKDCQSILNETQTGFLQSAEYKDYNTNSPIEPIISIEKFNVLKANISKSFTLIRIIKSKIK